MPHVMDFNAIRELPVFKRIQARVGKLSGDERREMRKRITATPEWRTVSKLNGIEASALSSTEQVLCAAYACDVQIYAAVQDMRGTEWRRDVTGSPDSNAMRATANAVFGRQHGKAASATQEKGNMPETYNDQASALIAAINSVIDAKPSIDEDAVRRIVDDALKDFKAPVTRIEVHDVDSGEKREVEGLAHKQLPLLITACNARDHKGHRMNVMIFGHRGTGKSQAARQVADALGLEFRQHGAMEFGTDLLGYVRQTDGAFHSTNFLHVYEHGGVILLDELDRWDSNATTALNGALADGELFTDDGRRVSRHRDCVVIATANTNGKGGDRTYTGANRLDAAFLDRFMLIEWVLDDALEMALIGNDEVYRYIRSMRRKAFSAGRDVEITTRMGLFMVSMIRAGASFDDAARVSVHGHLTADDMAALGVD